MWSDLHLHAEVKINNRWEHYSTAYLTTKNSIYSYLMAMYRFTKREKSVYHGGPQQDISPITKLAYKDLGLAPLVFMYPQQILFMANSLSSTIKKGNLGEGVDFLEDTIGDLFGKTWGGFAENPETYPKELENIRWVFWLEK